MEGQNINVSVYRAAQQADDVSGGAQRGAYALIATARGRLIQRVPTLEMRAQGLGSDMFYDAFVQPATTDVRANDMLIPADGPHAHERFLVTGVHGPGLKHFQSPRAHLKLQLERWDDGKMVDLI